jgi:TolB protein
VEKISTMRAALKIISFTLSQYALSCNDDSVSPNDGLIAFTLRDENGKLQIFTIRPDGTNQKQLTFEGENGRPDWSPDGKKMVYNSISNGAWIKVMDPDGSNKKFLTQGAAPDWSSNGKQIAFTREDQDQVPQLWVIDVDGNNLKQITTNSTFKIAPSWSPDGKNLVFVTPQNPTSPSHPKPELGIIGADGNHQRILTTEDRINIKINAPGDTTICETAFDANAPAWSPVENKIAFWSGIENNYGQIWVINSDGTGSKQLTEDCSHRNSDDPSWSPDGKKILFGTARSGKPELWMMDADGTNEKRIADLAASPFPGRATWQPVR